MADNLGPGFAAAAADRAGFRKMTQEELAKSVGLAVRYALTGGWFSPETPMQPERPDTAGRRFDFPSGINLWIQPRRDSGISFETLRNFAQSYDILRLVIETRKDQMVAFEWDIVPQNQVPGKPIPPEIQARMDYARTFFMRPDGSHDWNEWLRIILEDIFVCDAVPIWPTFDPANRKKLVALEYVDPATIKLVIDNSGRRPQPPLPAYQQILHGVPTSGYTSDELKYFIRNPRSHNMYGYSHVEQIMMTINIGLRRELSQLQYFTEGNIPEAIAGVPDTWDAQTIAQFQQWWDSILEGNTAQRRHLKFIPGDASKIQMLKGAEATLKQEFDEWIARIICYCFSVPPTPFVKQMNRATAEMAQEVSNEEGLVPLLHYIRGMMNSIMRDVMKLEGVEWRWKMEEDVDLGVQAKIDDTYIRNGVISVDDVRLRMGMAPLGVPNMVYLVTGPVPLSMFIDGTAPNLQPKPLPGEGGPGGEEANGENEEEGSSMASEASKAQEGDLSKVIPFRKGGEGAYSRSKIARVLRYNRGARIYKPPR